MKNASFKLTLYGCVVSICCVGFASLDAVCDELSDLPGILVCISFLISVCMFIVAKVLLISSAAVVVRTGGAIWLSPFANVVMSSLKSVVLCIRVAWMGAVCLLLCNEEPLLPCLCNYI